VKVLLFAALRELAGSSHVESDAPTVAALLDELSARFGPAFDRVMRVGTVVVNGETASRESKLGSDDEVALLPPVSGGQCEHRISPVKRRMR
jgi:sulfur-carrier protein